MRKDVVINHILVYHHKQMRPTFRQKFLRYVISKLHYDKSYRTKV